MTVWLVLSEVDDCEVCDDWDVADDDWDVVEEEAAVSGVELADDELDVAGVVAIVMPLVDLALVADTP
ncbi:MAG TPA: hypothetical protein VI316_08745 [Candidatus Dormibacteraeota bacterium]